MSKIFTFQEQLEVGKKGEELFLENYHEPLEVIEEHYGDFRVVSSGEMLELKTDTYDPNTSPNFFMERYSNYTKRAPGGPWQAYYKGATRFCYLFLKTGTYYEFVDVAELVNRLEEMITSLSYISVKNRGYYGRGYKIPRESLADLWEERTITITAEEPSNGNTDTE